MADQPFTRVGVIMLDTQFPRPVGDIGHPSSWSLRGLTPIYQVVQGAFPKHIVTLDAQPAWLSRFVHAALELIAQGSEVITTSCGFLARYQGALQAALTVPVITSGLLWCRELSQPGILTISSDRLGQLDLDGAAVPTETPVMGVNPHGEFHRCIMGNQAQMDLAQAENDVVDAALALVRQHPQVQNIVLECTNMPPYREAISACTGLPCWDVIDLVMQSFLKGQIDRG